MKLYFLFLLNVIATWTLAAPIPQTFENSDGKKRLIAVVIITDQPFRTKETKTYFQTRINQAEELTGGSKQWSAVGHNREVRDDALLKECDPHASTVQGPTIAGIAALKNANKAAPVEGRDVYADVAQLLRRKNSLS